MSRKNKISFLLLFIVSAFFFAVVVFYVRGVYLDLPYPFNTFLFSPNKRFSDFYIVIKESMDLNPYTGHSSGQYPFLLIVGYIFSFLPNSISYFIYVFIFAGILFFFSLYFLYTNSWFESLLPAFVITFLTYPFLFSIDRGNFESLLFLFLLAFIYFYSQKKYLPAAIFLALATSLKIYPGIFLILFLKDKKYKEIAISVGAIVAVTLTSLLCFQGGLLSNIMYLLNFSNISNNTNFLSFITLERGSFVQRGVPLLNLIKIIVLQNQIVLPEVFILNFLNIYKFLVCALFVPLIFYVIYAEEELWKNVALLTIAMLLFPYISADYKLIHILLPLFLFVNSKNTGKLDYFYILAFGLLLIPKSYFILSRIISDAWYDGEHLHDITLAVPINICILIIICLVIMFSGYSKRGQINNS